MDDDYAGLSRRELLAVAASMAMFVPLSLREALAQTALRRTPEDILGPFYPAGREPIRAIAPTAGKPGRAEGAHGPSHGPGPEREGRAGRRRQGRDLAGQYAWP